jgi:hypothetical protein
MVYLTLPGGETLPASEFASAQFWEAGAHREIGPIGEVDELVIKMKDSNHKPDPVIGQHAREYATALDGAGVLVYWRFKPK